MSERTKSAWESFLWPVLLLIVAPTATFTGSRIATGAWLAWVRAVPRLAWIVAAALVLVWVVLLLVRRRLAAMRGMSDSYCGIVQSNLASAWGLVGEVRYRGVRWRIEAPSPQNRIAMGRGIDGEPWIRASDVEVRMPPRCPECQTELEEQPRFFGGYRWTCIGCGFHKRNSDSYYTEGDRALRIARREIERAQERNAAPPRVDAEPPTEISVESLMDQVLGLLVVHPSLDDAQAGQLLKLAPGYMNTLRQAIGVLFTCGRIDKHPSVQGRFVLNRRSA